MYEQSNFSATLFVLYLAVLLQVTVKNVARVDPKTNQLMYNPTADELYIPKVCSLVVK